MAIRDFEELDSRFMIANDIWDYRWFENNSLDQSSQIKDKTAKIALSNFLSLLSKKEEKTFWQKYRKEVEITTDAVVVGSNVANSTISGFATLAEELSVSETNLLETADQNVSTLPIDEKSLKSLF
jgi:capsule polysaccharide export protein KpsE/RkpR